MNSSRFGSFLKFSILDFTTDAESFLSIEYHDKKHYLHKISKSTIKFLTDDLDVSRLDRIQIYFIELRLTDRYKAVARSLHRQLIINRRVNVTEQTDLHLT